MADDSARKPKEQAKMSELPDRGSSKSSDYESIQDEMSDLRGSSMSVRSELEGVLLHTRRLIVYDRYSKTHIGPGREGEKFGQETVLRGDAGPQFLHVNEWISTGDETHLGLLRHAYYLRDDLSILAPLCPTVKHISIDSHMIRRIPFTPMPMHMPMRSVITVCIKFLYCLGKLQETLSEVGNLFPNAESLDMQIGSLSSPFDQAYSHEVNSSSSLRELKLRFEGRYDITTDNLLMDISTSCPNIVSLVLLGFGRWLSNKSGKVITSCKMPHLTNIHLEPSETYDCYRFVTLMNVFHAISPRLRFVEAKKVQLGDAELTSVKWSQIFSGFELQLEGASAAVPMLDLMHLVSNELEGVNVLTFDRSKVDIPQSTSHLPQSTGKESSLRELKFLNVECPLSQTDFHKLSEMYPNVKVTVEHERQASHEDSKQGTRMPFNLERETSPSSSPTSFPPTSSIDDLVGATARVQVHEELTDTQNAEEDGKEEEEEENTSMESLHRETDEVNVKPIKMECCKRVGVKGGKLQLDSFGIELEIPPGAIDSEAPRNISLKVLTDTLNLSNNEEEMSVCFGVQCLAPDDLVLKLPVTYTIPHSAVITQYSTVEAVLYTGEGEYSPDAVVKERSILSRSGISSCTIKKYVIELKMNHFSWMMIKFLFGNFSLFGNLFSRKKRMCCRPFKEKNLSLQKTPVILHVHIYDDVKGNSEVVEIKEEKHEFVPAHMELQILIQESEGDLKMTCYLNRTIIGGPVVVPIDRLMSGAMICRPFQLNFTNQPDIVAVSLIVGQIDSVPDEFLFRLDFSTPHTTEGASQQDLGRQEDFDGKLKAVARKVDRRDEIDDLGKALGFEPEDIQRYVDTNMKNADVSYMGTLSMLRKWRKKQTNAIECEALKDVLRKAGQIRLVFELFGTS